MSELAARVRAARNYAGLRQEDLADELGVDVQTIKRRENGTSDPKKGERRAIAAICGVPKEFFDTSKPLELIGPLDVSERVQMLGDQLERADARLAELGAEVADLRAHALTDDQRAALAELTGGGHDLWSIEPDHPGSDETEDEGATGGGAS
jgi:transcriptional regulator with XRE-family HTH domain